MAGTQTAGFDLGMQFSEQAYRDLLGVFFDEGGLIGEIVDLIPGVDADAFTVDLSFDRPTDVSIPSTAESPIDIRIGIGEAGALATVRMVVGMGVDRSAADRDTVRINFADSIHHAAVTVAGVNVPIPNLAGRLQDRIPSLPVLPVPVDRATADPTVIRRVDFRVVDDTGTSDQDVTAAMLTFGGGGTGDLGSVRSFVPAGGRGAIGIFFPWLCRLAVPSLERALNLPAGSFDISNDRCALNRRVRVDEEEEVDLTSMTLTLRDGFIDIAARVEKSGFCYEATGDVSARLRLEIRDGRLVASAEVGDPDVDVSMPWYCWIGAAVIGAVLGGVLAGVIGAIVGGILVPLITWLTVDVVEGTIDRVADRIVEAINTAIPEIDVPAFGVNILFQAVFIDDVVLQADLQVESHAPVRAEGTAVLRPGQGLDLDTGKVGGPEMAVADVKWTGRGNARRLETGCQAALARTGSGSFDGVSRFQLYAYEYQRRASVPFWELGVPNPVPWLIPGGDVLEFNRVYAVRTNEGRYAIVQVVEVEDEHVRVRYRTFQGNEVGVSITGDFKCVKPIWGPKDAAVVFEPRVSALATAAATGVFSRVTAAGRLKPIEDDCGDSAPAGHAPGHGHDAASPGVAVPPCARELPLPPIQDGRWVTVFDAPQTAQARLKAVASGSSEKRQYIWSVNGRALEDGGSGTVEVDGEKVKYTVRGPDLLLSVRDKAVVELLVKVDLVDERGCSATATRCLHHDGKCPTKVRHVPSWKQFRELHAAPAVAVAPPVQHTHLR